MSVPVPPLAKIAGGTALPERVDVVVIGGGIAGVAAAYFLARKGRSVALLEKGHVAGEQSSCNWGWCRTQNRDRRELPLQLLRMDIWDSLALPAPTRSPTSSPAATCWSACSRSRPRRRAS